MSIHAKSLNQLVYELENRGRTQATPEPPKAVSSPKSELANELAELKKFIEDFRFPSTAQAPPAGQATAPAPPERSPEPAFYMDSTLGTRLHPEQAAEARKREAEIRFYSGFASRSDITGND